MSTPEKTRGYSGRHMYVRRTRGSAALQLCAGCCGRRAEEWACVHGKDGQSLNDYVALCRKCHRQYDGTGKYKKTPEHIKNMSAWRVGKKLSPEWRDAISRGAKGRPAWNKGLKKSEYPNAPI